MILVTHYKTCLGSQINIVIKLFTRDQMNSMSGIPYTCSHIMLRLLLTWSFDSLKCEINSEPLFAFQWFSCSVFFSVQWLLKNKVKMGNGKLSDQLLFKQQNRLRSENISCFRSEFMFSDRKWNYHRVINFGGMYVFLSDNYAVFFIKCSFYKRSFDNKEIQLEIKLIPF